MVQYSNEDLLEALVECKERHGEINTQILNNDSNLPSGPIYSYRFESMSDAAEKAGLHDEAKKLEQNRKKRIGYSDKEIESFIEDIANDGIVTRKMIEEADGPSSNTVSNYLGTQSIVGERISGIDIISEAERD